MLQQINSNHLAALEAELARVTAQRDALRQALLPIVADVDVRDMMTWDQVHNARAALQACQD